jgi:hypothetical protein
MLAGLVVPAADEAILTRVHVIAEMGDFKADDAVLEAEEIRAGCPLFLLASR